MNEWIIFWIDMCHFWWKVPFFFLFWTLFGQFLGTFPIRPVSKSPWLLNWIIFWIVSAEFLNWIIFWIESWVKRYWIEYWINHFLAKFKHWIESDRVSNTPSWGAHLDYWGAVVQKSWDKMIGQKIIFRWKLIMTKSLRSTDRNSVIVPSWTFLIWLILDCPNHLRHQMPSQKLYVDHLQVISFA